MSKYLLVLLLSGCYYQDITGVELDKLTQYCKDKGGIYELTVYARDEVIVTCRSGHTTYVSNIEEVFSWDPIDCQE